MFRILAVLLVVVGTIGCEFVEQTAYVPEDAAEITSNWLAAFSHANPEYVDQAKSAYAYAADGELCEAGWKFDDIVEDARERDGSRMPIASYNAGVLYAVAGWAGNTCWSRSRGGVGPISRLEYALQHMPDRSLDASIHMLLGNAYFNNLEGFDDYERSRQSSRVAEIKEKSIEHYCAAVALEPFYRDQVEEQFQEAEWSPCQD